MNIAPRSNDRGERPRSFRSTASTETRVYETLDQFFVNNDISCIFFISLLLFELPFFINTLLCFCIIIKKIHAQFYKNFSYVLHILRTRYEWTLLNKFNRILNKYSGFEFDKNTYIYIYKINTKSRRISNSQRTLQIIKLRNKRKSIDRYWLTIDDKRDELRLNRILH